MRAGEPLIRAEGLGVRAQDHWVLRNVDIAVASGEIVTLIGPNGGGKTTLVRALLGVAHIHRGTVVRRPGLTVGYVPQRLRIDPTLPLTVRRMMTATSRHDGAELRQALEATGVAHTLDRPVQRLSGGELQRVLLARAMMRKPALLVLDEPVQGVDYAGEAALYQLIADTRARTGCGVLMVSHDLHIVMAATDRVVCLNGHVCCTGSAHDVSGSPEYRALFGPRAVDAIAVYAHKHDHEHV
ncbi:MAG: metal ABC transporter ATP-binding protein [Alphaproteobacteria bacterium]